jgi:hypothetical protein
LTCGGSFNSYYDGSYRDGSYRFVVVVAAAVITATVVTIRAGRIPAIPVVDSGAARIERIEELTGVLEATSLEPAAAVVARVDWTIQSSLDVLKTSD